MNCTVRYGCRLNLKSRTSNFELSFYCLMVPITQKLSSFLIRASPLLIAKNLMLSDHFFTIPRVLMGSEFFFLLENKKIKNSDVMQILRNKKLG